MWEGFPKVLQSVFPNARIVFDRFHFMQQLYLYFYNFIILVKVTSRKAKYLLFINGKDLKTEELEELNNIFCVHPCL